MSIRCMERYNIFFVPRFPERKVLSELRRRFCRDLNSRDALRSPVHMSLISGGFTCEYSDVRDDLKELCRKTSPMKFAINKQIAILPKISWAGLHIQRTPKIKRFQEQLQRIRNTHARDQQEHYFRPLHITLAHPANVNDMKPHPSPFKTLLFDRITVCKKEGDIYRIHKHIILRKY